jgi:large subunit ribosomal protein L10
LAITKERKRNLLDKYLDLLQRSQALILTDYQGLDVPKITELRTQVRQANGVYYVTKNTLISLALKKANLEVPEEWVTGPTAIGFCLEEIPGVAKAINDFAKEFEALTIKGGFLGNEPISEAKVKELASLPPLEILQAQMLGTLTAPMSGLVNVLNGVLAGMVNVLEARRDQLSEAEPA